MTAVLLAVFDILVSKFAPDVLRPFMPIARSFLAQVRIPIGQENAAVQIFADYMEKARDVIVAAPDESFVESGLVALEVEFGQALKDANLLPTG